MDASKIKTASSAPMHVKDASGVPLYEGDKPVRIIFHGPGSRAYSTVQSRQTARQLKRMNDNDGKITAPSAEEGRLETAEDLASVTIEFEELTYGDKKGIELFEAVFSDPDLSYIAKQATKFLADAGNFKTASVES
jgi:hypothetical protein